MPPRIEEDDRRPREAVRALDDPDREPLGGLHDLDGWHRKRLFRAEGRDLLGQGLFLGAAGQGHQQGGQGAAMTITERRVFMVTSSPGWQAPAWRSMTVRLATVR